MGASAERKVYVKVKEKFGGDAGGFPHLREETGCMRLVEGLSIQDCRNPFPALRRCGSAEDRQRVERLPRG